MTPIRTLLNLSASTVKSVIDHMSQQLNNILRFVFFLLILANIHTSQATEKSALAPGEISIEFTSEQDINLYALKAKKIEILNQLSKYITLEITVDSQLTELTTVELNNHSFAQLLIHLLADHNHVVWYRSNSYTQRQATTLRLHETEPGSKIKQIEYTDLSSSISKSKNLSTFNKNINEVIENYGDLKNVDSIKRFEKIINSADTKQKLEACNSLGDIGTTRAVSLLKGLVLDSNPKVREEAVYALGDISSEPAVKVLALAVNDSVANIQLLAISELSQINSDSSVRALDIALNDQNPHIRLKAVYALGQQNTVQSKEILWQLVQSNELPIAMAANEILTQLNKQ